MEDEYKIEATETMEDGDKKSITTTIIREDKTETVATLKEKVNTALDQEIFEAVISKENSNVKRNLTKGIDIIVDHSEEVEKIDEEEIKNETKEEEKIEEELSDSDESTVICNLGGFLKYINSLADDYDNKNKASGSFENTITKDEKHEKENSNSSTSLPANLITKTNALKLESKYDGQFTVEKTEGENPLFEDKINNGSAMVNKERKGTALLEYIPPSSTTKGLYENSNASEADIKKNDFVRSLGKFCFNFLCSTIIFFLLYLSVNILSPAFGVSRSTIFTMYYIFGIFATLFYFGNVLLIGNDFDYKQYGIKIGWLIPYALLCIYINIWRWSSGLTLNEVIEKF